MFCFAGIEKDGKLETSLDSVSKTISEDHRIAIGKPLTIELMSVQLSNLHLEKEKPLIGRSEDKPPLLPIIISRCRSGERSPDGKWERPEICQLHYDAALSETEKFITRSELDASSCKRSPLLHHIPVYEGQRVNLTLSIYELDKPIPEKTKQAINDIFGVAAAVFLPYSPFIFGAKKLFEVFVELHDANIRHDVFLDETERIEWSPDTRLHHASTCFLIYVQDKYPSGRKIDPAFVPSNWKVNNDDFRLVDINNERNKLTDRCYAVLYISNRGLQPAEQLFGNSQKAATLLSEIEAQQKNDDGHTIVWKQLLNTMNSYSTGKDIQRILDLKENLDSLSDDDMAKLKGYLNIPSIKALGFYDTLRKDVNLG